MTQTEHFQKLIDLAFALTNSTTFLSKLTQPDVSLSRGIEMANVHRGAFNNLFDYLRTECPKPQPPSIAVEICGGCLTAIHADEPMGVDLRDWDNISEGDEDPFAEFVTEPSTSKRYAATVDWDKAGYPYSVW